MASLLLLLLLLLLSAFCMGGDTLSKGQSLRVGQSISSQGQISFFLLGFTNLHGSTSREEKWYLAVRYVGPKNSRVVWVANRETPITDSTGVANISGDGVLSLYQGSKLVWQSSNDLRSANPTALQLLQTGNLVVTDLVTNRKLWQSFDYPTNTMLPTMRLGEDRRTGRKLNLTSWKSRVDPSPGEYSYGICDGGGRRYENCITGPGGSIRYRTGPWNGKRFTGNTKFAEAEGSINFSFVVGNDASYYSFDVVPNSQISTSWLALEPDGVVDREAITANKSRTLVSLWRRPTDSCDNYDECGPNGLCDNDGCACLPGFRKVGASSLLPGSAPPGCRRQKELECGEGDSFLVLEEVKLPDTFNATTTVGGGGSLDDCRDACLRNCSCVAYAAADVRGSGCIRYSGDLLDARKFAVKGQDRLFLKVPASLIPPAQNNSSSKRGKSNVIVAISLSIGIAIIAAIIACGYCIWKRSSSPGEMEIGIVHSMHSGGSNLDEDLSLLDYATIARATRNFSDTIGEGGFGLVYRGNLGDGKIVAVKRQRMQGTEQGQDEFVNEARLIAKLQHKNLIRLMACCIEGEERMLVYEYMCNGSLDKFIFDEEQRAKLDWRTRANIVVGIARGLVYLHEDSRLKIIHRDLKAGNVLLDEAMNPKISDFGTARLFLADQSEDKTRTVVGTIGYISPEYAMDGTFSIKSDVFSFGVLLLEIVGGMRSMKPTKNKESFHEMMDKNLLALTWRLWREDNGLQLLDEKMPEPQPEEALRYVQIGLLCVQECADDRPTMSQVHSMLTNEEKRLEEPRKPGIYQGGLSKKNQLQSSGSGSVGYMTATAVEGR